MALASNDPSELVVALNLLRQLLECCSRKPEGAAVLPDLLHGLLKCAANPSSEVRCPFSARQPSAVPPSTVLSAHQNARQTPLWRWGAAFWPGRPQNAA